MPDYLLLFIIVPVIISVIFALFLAMVSNSITPNRAAKNIKMMGMAGQVKKRFHAELMIALEDEEIRALFYDAMQEEATKRRNKP